VKLSAFSIVDAPPEGDGGGRLAEVVALAEAAEGAGLENVWVAEHHFQPGGLCPSPPVLLAACGARTRRIGLGVMVSVLPFHRPIDLAEEYAVLDRLTGGRLRLGVGSGYIPLEFEGFGVDPATKRDRFDRNLDDLLAAFAGREVRVDVPGAAAVRINVRPVQTPHPPIWIAVQRREAIPYVARRGASLALIPYATVASREELAAEIREFRAAVPGGARPEVAVALHVYAGDDPGRARAAFGRYLAGRLRTQSAFYEQKVRHEPHLASPEALEAGGFAVFGSPQETARGLEAYAEIGVDELLGIFDFGGLPPAEVAASVRALGAAMARP
jgi:alkanesulfonate monooxygenase SsuD/methylene tetrahydromethanopterin reductase-like flavin-dependent oxidoreductase (luciferase family)